MELETKIALEINKKIMGNLLTSQDIATDKQYIENAMAITFVY